MPDLNITGKHDTQPGAPTIYTARHPGAAYSPGNFRVEPDCATVRLQVVAQGDVFRIIGNGEWKWDAASTATDSGTEQTGAIAITGITTGRYLRRSHDVALSGTTTGCDVGDIVHATSPGVYQKVQADTVAHMMGPLFVVAATGVVVPLEGAVVNTTEEAVADSPLYVSATTAGKATSTDPANGIPQPFALSCSAVLSSATARVSINHAVSGASSRDEYLRARAVALTGMNPNKLVVRSQRFLNGEGISGGPSVLLGTLLAPFEASIDFQAARIVNRWSITNVLPSARISTQKWYIHFASRIVEAGYGHNVSLQRGVYNSNSEAEVVEVFNYVGAYPSPYHLGMSTGNYSPGVHPELRAIVDLGANDLLKHEFEFCCSADGNVSVVLDGAVHTAALAAGTVEEAARLEITTNGSIWDVTIIREES